jgi:hypothetical protein
VQDFSRGEALLARVGEGIVEPLVADLRAEERVGLEQPFPVAIDEVSRCTRGFTHSEHPCLTADTS